MQPVNVKFRIKQDGTICGLWDDVAELQDIGRCSVHRASHVEYDNRICRWVVTTVGWRRKVLFTAYTREAALTWESMYFRPGSPGWLLLQRKSTWQRFRQLVSRLWNSQ